MKNIAGTLLLSLSVLLYSCSSDFEVPTISENVNLLGYWIAVDIEYSEESTVNAVGQPPENYQISGATISTDLNLAFMENPNLFVSNGGILFDLTTTGNDSTNTEKVGDISLFISSASWDRQGNTITLTANDNSELYTIEELTPSRLVLTHEGSTTTTDQSSGTTTQTNSFSRIVLGPE